MDKYFKKFTFHPKLYASSFPGDAKERNILLWERNNARLRWNTHGPEEPFWFLGSYKLIASNCPEQVSLSWQHWQRGPHDAGCGDCPVHCRVFSSISLGPFPSAHNMAAFLTHPVVTTTCAPILLAVCWSQAQSTAPVENHSASEGLLLVHISVNLMSGMPVLFTS